MFKVFNTWKIFQSRNFSLEKFNNCEKVVFKLLFLLTVAFNSRMHAQLTYLRTGACHRPHNFRWYQPKHGEHLQHSARYVAREQCSYGNFCPFCCSFGCQCWSYCNVCYRHVWATKAFIKTFYLVLANRSCIKVEKESNLVFSWTASKLLSP